MKRLAAIWCVLIAVTALASDSPARVRDGRGRVGRGGLPTSTSAALCTPTIQGGSFVIDGSDWSTVASGVNTATLTANGGDGPPGSCAIGTASHLQISAVPSGYAMANISTPPVGVGSQMCAGTTSNISYAYWVKPTTTTTVDICSNDNANNTQCHSCSVTANIWTWCPVQNQPFWLSSNAFYIGSDWVDNGNNARSSLDALIYAPRCVVGSSISQ